MKIVVLGAGVQGTLYAVRLSRAGHEVTLIARGSRAAELRKFGAVIQDALSGQADKIQLPVIERLDPDTHADLCLVTIRREQIGEAIGELKSASVARIVFMVNHADGSDEIKKALGVRRLVLAFPGAAGSIEQGVDHYVEIPQQPTAVEKSAIDVVSTFRAAGFRTSPIDDMDAWLRRHAVFIIAIAGSLYDSGCDARRLAANESSLRRFIRAVREGWSALDRAGIAAESLALRAIFRQVPLPLAALYWRRLLASRGELYFARHARKSPGEMAALGADVKQLLSDSPAPNLRELLAAIDTAANQLR